MQEVANYFREIRKKYSPYESEFTGVDANVLRYQIPGGMISNLVLQLSEQDAIDRLQDVLEEVSRVREELGYPPLVTPTSQIVGTQAVMNVIMGQRYQVIPKEVQNLVRGFYGQLAAPVAPDIAEKALRGEKLIKCRPADLIKPEWDNNAKETAKILNRNPTDEEVLSYSLFPNVATTFFLQPSSGATDDIAAAIIAALAVEHQFIELQDKGVPPGADHNPWRLVGREMMSWRRQTVLTRGRN